MSYETHSEATHQKQVTQSGHSNVYIEGAQNVYFTMQVKGESSMGAGPNARIPEFSQKFYHLFVTDGEDFHDKSPFLIPHEFLLQKETDPKLTLKYASLSEKSIQELKTFPCLFTRKNIYFGHTTENHFVKLGFIREIENLRTGIKIYPEFVSPQPVIPQQRLNENLKAFDLWGHELINELDDIHWSIKEADLFQVLLKLQFLIS